jgi:hypothetical protein
MRALGHDAADVDEIAVAEAIDIGESCGIHVQIAHLKLSGIDSY